MFKVLLVVCLGVCSIQGETECQTSFHTCLKSGMDQLKANQPAKPDFAAKKAEFEKCFTDQSCTAPAKPEPKHEGFAQVKECFKKGGDIIETCVKATYPGFSFPTPPADNDANAEQHHFGFGGHGSWNHGGDHGDMKGQDGWKGKGKEGKGKGKGKEGKGKGKEGKGKGKGHDRGEHDDKKAAFLQTACNNDTAKAQAVDTCLNLLKNKSMEEWKAAAAAGQHQQRQNPRKLFCEIKNNCTAQLSADCQKEKENIEAALCKCATEHSEDVKKEVSSCFTPPPSTAAPVASDDVAVASGNANHFGGFSGHQGSGNHKGFGGNGREQFSLATMFCQKHNDKCDEGNNAENRGRLSHNNNSDRNAGRVNSEGGNNNGHESRGHGHSGGGQEHGGRRRNN